MNHVKPAVSKDRGIESTPCIAVSKSFTFFKVLVLVYLYKNVYYKLFYSHLKLCIPAYGLFIYFLEEAYGLSI